MSPKIDQTLKHHDVCLWSTSNQQSEYAACMACNDVAICVPSDLSLSDRYLMDEGAISPALCRTVARAPTFNSTTTAPRIIISGYSSAKYYEHKTIQGIKTRKS